MAKGKGIGKKIVTGKCRLSYQNLFAPDNGEMGKGKYGCSLIMERDDPTLKELKQAVLAVAKEMIGAEAKFSDFNHPFIDGNTKPQNPEYKDKIILRPNSKYRPNVVLGNLSAATESDVYSGCYVRAALTPHWYDQKGRKGVSFFLGNVQKMANGERLGGGGPVDASEDFDEMAEATEGGASAPTDDSDDMPF